MSDTSDSDVEVSSKTKANKPTVFDNNIFDAEESDEKSKPINSKKKINQQQSQQTKKPIVKTNNEQIKKDKPQKVNDEQSITKKKITIPKPTEKKKVTVNSTKPTLKTTVSAQKRPSTDELHESAKKLKLDDEKSKPTSIEERISAMQTESEISTPTKPAIVITSPAALESSTNPPKIAEPSAETNPQTTPTKFGIVFTSHHRHSNTPPSSSIRKQSTETPVSHETSKNDDEEMDDDNNNNHTINKNEQVSVNTNTNTLKPPTLTQPPLSDDETLNPETMQLSDLIGGSRREGTKPVQSRSTAKTTGKGKRTTKQDTSSNKRQQTKTNAKTVQPTKSKEKESEPSVDSTPVPSVEPTPSVITNTKRVSTTESVAVSSPNNDKEVKRLRKSTENSTIQPQIKLEPIENLSPWANTQVKQEIIEPTLTPAEIPKQEILPKIPAGIEQSQITPMETDQIPTLTSSASSIITSTKSPSTTSPETETAIKAVYSTVQISQQPIPKTPNLEKSSPVIAPISKETLPIVEHQPTSIQTTSKLPSHVPMKSSITSATFSMFCFCLVIFYRVLFFSLDENVEETLSAVNSLLMLNNNPSNISGDHPALKGAARVTPTISKPVYTFVASLPSPTDQQTRQTTTTTAATVVPPPTTSVSTPPTQQTDLITMVSNIVSASNLSGEKQPVTTTTATPTITTSRSHIEEVIDDVAKNSSSSATTIAAAIATEPTTSIVDTNTLTSTSSSGTTKSTSIPNILRDVMKTPCLTSSTTVTTTTTTTAASETLNLFDTHRRSTSPLKATTTTATTITAPIPVVPVVVRPTSSKTPTTHKRSSTPKTEIPTPTPLPMMHPFPHMLTAEGTIYAAAAAAAHHQNFPFPIFGPLSGNPANPTGNSSTNLLASSLVSNSPPLSTRTSSTSSSSPSTNSHIMTNPFLNTIMAGQQNLSTANSNQHTHEKPSRR